MGESFTTSEIQKERRDSYRTKLRLLLTLEANTSPDNPPPPTSMPAERVLRHPPNIIENKKSRIHAGLQQ